MAKKPVSLLHLHKLFRDVWDEEKKEEEEMKKKKGGNSESVGTSAEELGPGAMLSHQDDIFHPDNLVQKSFPFLTITQLVTKLCR